MKVIGDVFKTRTRAEAANQSVLRIFLQRRINLADQVQAVENDIGIIVHDCDATRFERAFFLAAWQKLIKFLFPDQLELFHLRHLSIIVMWDN